MRKDNPTQMKPEDKIIYDKLTKILCPPRKKRHIHLWDGADGIQSCYECGVKGYQTSKGRMRVIRDR